MAKVGRKFFDGKDEKEIITKLEEVWAIGGSDKEAAFFADISPMSLSRYLEAKPLIALRKQALLNNPILKARRAVVEGLDGNPDFSLKYLERKVSKEFAPKHKLEHTGEDGGAIEIKDARQTLDAKLANLASKSEKARVNKKSKQR